MKCICGYYHIDTNDEWEVERLAKELGRDIESDVERESIIANNGKDKFPTIEGKFDIDKKRSWERFSYVEPANITLYICPKCFTVRVSEYIT